LSRPRSARSGTRAGSVRSLGHRPGRHRVTIRSTAMSYGRPPTVSADRPGPKGEQPAMRSVRGLGSPASAHRGSTMATHSGRTRLASLRGPRSARSWAGDIGRAERGNTPVQPPHLAKEAARCIGLLVDRDAGPVAARVGPLPAHLGVVGEVEALLDPTAGQVPGVAVPA
jgi:hypothetical protein